MEKMGQRFYGYYADLFEGEVHDFLAEMSVLEEGHFKLLDEKYETFMGEKLLKDSSWVMDDTSKVNHTDIFENADKILEMNENVDAEEVLKMAYLFESDFAGFYTRASELADDEEVKNFLKELAEWEIEHAHEVMKRYVKLKQKDWDNIINKIID
jgi:rubrerythrin